jgi:SAM-dependent methyltransferase
MKDLPIRDIFQWDSVNWSRSLRLWNKVLDSSPGIALEIGGREGGLALLAALHGHQALCSDLENPEHIATPFHSRHNTGKLIRYASVNALDIPYKDEFDMVMVKSVITMIGRHGRKDLQQKALDEIFAALKPGGYLLFAENMKGSRLHVWLRNRFVPWGNEAGYLDWKEASVWFASKGELQFGTAGFFASFGRSESQRRMLGKLDKITDWIWPLNMKYMVYGIVRKPLSA